MDSISDVFDGVFADGSALMLAVLVFLATAILAFGVMAAVRVRGAVKRRTAGIAALVRRRLGARTRALAAAVEPQGGPAGARLHHQALRQRRQGRLPRCCASAWCGPASSIRARSAISSSAA